MGYPFSEAEWHSYQVDDPSWEEDLELFTAYQQQHWLPPTRSRRPPISATVPISIPTAVAPPPTSVSSVPIFSSPPPALSPHVPRTTRQSRYPVLNPGL
jgi:hypothetical protein